MRRTAAHSKLTAALSRAAVCVLAVAASIFNAAASTQAADSAKVAEKGDRIVLPPDQETFESQEGRYQLVISTIDKSGWKSRRSAAELRHKVGDSWQSRWRVDLPHAYRPRFAVVSPKGEVVLFDEWINIITRLTIVVLDPMGKVVATSDSGAVLAALGLPGRDVVPTAKYGWWLQAPPVVSQDGMYAEARAAGRTLRIRFSDGSMSRM